MQPPFPFDLMLLFGSLAAMLLIGVFLRAKVPFFQNWGIRKGLAAHGPESLPKDILVGVLSRNQKAEPAGRLTFHSGNVESLALMNIFSIPGIGLCLVLVNGPVWWNWNIALTILVFLAVMVVALALLKVLKLWGSPKF